MAEAARLPRVVREVLSEEGTSEEHRSDKREGGSLRISGIMMSQAEVTGSAKALRQKLACCAGRTAWRRVARSRGREREGKKVKEETRIR